jgi:hypothetical protein
MSSFRWADVKRVKRGAVWGDGAPRLCTGCAVQGRRRREAVVTAVLVRGGAGHRVPVAYCGDHVPDGLEVRL